MINVSVREDMNFCAIFVIASNICLNMADNYLENKMDAFRAKESDTTDRKKKELAKKMRAYQEKLRARRKEEFGK